MSILFIADQFADAPRTVAVRHPGGAELTDAAAIAAAEEPVETRTFADLRPDDLREHELIVVGNSGSATSDQLDAIAETGRYVSFEHDVRICHWRGNYPAAPEPFHRFGRRCVCPSRTMSRFYENALGVVYLTSLQQRAFEENPFYASPPSSVLGCSLFGDAFFERVDSSRPTRRTGSVVYAAPDPIKGYREALDYCLRLGLSPTVIQNVLPHEVLDIFEESERFIYLPIALEPAGRMPVEARFLGCEVVCNEWVGVAGEPWWQWPDDEALQFLRDAPRRFWSQVHSFAT